MGFAFPAAAALALLALPLVALYFLKLRRRRVVVSSTLAWRRAATDRRVNAPWQRLRRHLLLLLQLLVLAFVTLAATGPFLRSDAVLARQTAIVLDVSASMACRTGDAGPGERTRFDAAREAVARLIEAVGEGRRAALVIAAAEPTVAAPLADSRAELSRALAAASPLDTGADLVAAIELARSLVRTADGGEVVLVTDGAITPDPRLRDALRSCRVISVGGAAENAGLVGVSLRAAPSEAGTHELLASIAWHGSTARAAALTVESAPAETPGSAVSASGPWSLLEEIELILSPGSTRDHVLRVSAEPGTLLRLRLAGAEGDALAADDEAVVVVPRPRDVDVLVVSERASPVARALAAVPAVRVHRAPTLPADLDPFAAVVLDGVGPGSPPRAPTLAFLGGEERRDDDGWGRTIRRLERPRIARWDRRHPALRHADLDPVTLGVAWVTEPPVPARSVVELEDGPTCHAWDAATGRVMACGFELLDTDLPLHVAFPIWMHDAVDWLTQRGTDPGVMPTGRRRVMPWPAGAPRRPARAHVRGPAGWSAELRLETGELELPILVRRGLHEVVLTPETDAAEPFRHRVGVALLSRWETDPSARLPSVSAAPAAPRVVRRPGRRELWHWAVALALLALSGEWWLFHRRPS